MQNVTAYRAEVAYRQEQVAREFRPTRVRRVTRALARATRSTRTPAA